MTDPLGDEYQTPVKSASSDKVYRATVKGDVAECHEYEAGGGVLPWGCAHSQHTYPMDSRSKWCRHALEARNRLLDDVNTMLRNLVNTKQDPEAGKHLFLEVTNAVVAFRSDEANIIAAAMLFKARVDGEVSADDVHALVGQYISGDRRIIGSVAGALLKQGLLRIVELPVKWVALSMGREVASGEARTIGGMALIPAGLLPAGVFDVRIEVPRQGKSSERTMDNHGREIKRFTLTQAGQNKLEASVRAKSIEVIDWPIEDRR